MHIDPIDTITLDIPLLLRIMEYCKEDAESDVELHNMLTNMLKLSKSHDVLNMSNYQLIISKPTNEAQSNMNKPLSHTYQLSKFQFKTFLNNFTKLNSGNTVTKEPNGMIVGFRKGSKQIFWRYDPSDSELYADAKDRPLLLINSPERNTAYK